MDTPRTPTSIFLECHSKHVPCFGIHSTDPYHRVLYGSKNTFTSSEGHRRFVIFGPILPNEIYFEREGGEGSSHNHHSQLCESIEEQWVNNDEGFSSHIPSLCFRLPTSGWGTITDSVSYMLRLKFTHGDVTIPFELKRSRDFDNDIESGYTQHPLKYQKLFYRDNISIFGLFYCSPENSGLVIEYSDFFNNGSCEDWASMTVEALEDTPAREPVILGGVDYLIPLSSDPRIIKATPDKVFPGFDTLITLTLSALPSDRYTILFGKCIAEVVSEEENLWNEVLVLCRVNPNLRAGEVVYVGLRIHRDPLPLVGCKTIHSTPKEFIFITGRSVANIHPPYLPVPIGDDSINFSDSPPSLLIEELGYPDMILPYNDPNGNTFTHYVAFSGNLEWAQKYLLLGYEATARNKDGLTPIDIAQIKGHSKMTSLLYSVFLNLLPLSKQYVHSEIDTPKPLATECINKTEKLDVPKVSWYKDWDLQQAVKSAKLGLTVQPFNPYPKPNLKKNTSASLNAFRYYMMKVASTHNAKGCTFNVKNNALYFDSKTKKVIEERKTDIREKILKEGTGRYNAIARGLKKKIKDIMDEIPDRENMNFTVFAKVQKKLLCLLLEPKYVRQLVSKNTPIGVHLCTQVWPESEVSVADTLKNIGRFLKKQSCPNTGNRELFDLLGIKTNLEVKKINFTEQTKNITEIERTLDFRPDIRCVGFMPTALQREILDSIDARDNFAVRSPAGSGKTMLSLYLASKMAKEGKKTVYIGPSKPICFEFSLFVEHQDILSCSIAYEDVIYWNELDSVNVFVCTPATFVKMMLFPQIPNIIESIGAIIFDELPRMMINHAADIAILLMLSYTKNWQTMVLSASLSDQVYYHLKEIFGDPFPLLQPRYSTRQTDLVFAESTGNSGTPFKLIHTSSTYTPLLLSERKDQRLDRALRFPITLSEFKEVFSNITVDVRDDLCNKVFPKTRVIDGRDITNFALHNAELGMIDKDIVKSTEIEELELSGEEEEKIDSKEIHFGFEDSEDSDQELEEKCDISPKDIEKLFLFLLNLNRTKRLPVMLFHSSSDVLERYHKGITRQYSQYLQKCDKRNKKKGKFYIPKEGDSKLLDEGESATSGSVELLFGLGLGDEQAKEIFKHRPNKKDNTTKYKFGRAGKAFKKSEHYEGIKLGLGIHHKGVDKKARDAVEAGLRLGYVKVVFCTGSMALGLNMPVKTVVFLGSEKENRLLSPNSILQAGGRAGRWGCGDKEGTIIFYDCNKTIFNQVWAPLRTFKNKWVFLPHVVLRLLAADKRISMDLTRWITEFKNIKLYSWDNSLTKFGIMVIILKDLGLISQGDDNHFGLTDAGKVALSISSEGRCSLMAGYLYYKYFDELKRLITSKTDLMFVLSHFIRGWRARAGLSKEPKTSLISVSISAELKNLMNRVRKEIETKSKGIVRLSKPDRISSLYVVYPSLKHFDDKIPHSLGERLFGHFVGKMVVLQRFAQFPYAEKVLDYWTHQLGLS